MKFCTSLFRVSADDYLEIARVADTYGWDTLLLSDHLLHPERIASPYPYDPSGERPWEASDDFPDIWVASAMMAAVTTRLKLLQMVYILPLREPYSVAKSLGTAARMSDYRVGLGLGLGWMREEFDLVGQDFAVRGARCDEMVEVMRKLFTGEMVEHHGRFFDFDRLCMRPAADGPIPVVVGGNSRPALRRVARLGDGWAPAFVSDEELVAGIAEIRSQQSEFGRADAPLAVYYRPLDFPDPDEIRRLEDMGVTHCTVAPWGQDDPPPPLAHRLDGMKRFGDDVIAKLGDGGG